MKLPLQLILLFLGVVAVSAQEKFTVTDTRDGQVYNAIEFTIPLPGGVNIKRAWLLENANYTTDEGSFCYDDEPAYCEKFGRLYNFEAALKACPEGWGVPTRKDWLLFLSIFGGNDTAGAALAEGGPSGMNFLLGGYGTEFGHYSSVGQQGHFWDSASKGEEPDGVVSITLEKSSVDLGPVGKRFLNSCRCIRNH